MLISLTALRQVEINSRCYFQRQILLPGTTVLIALNYYTCYYLLQHVLLLITTYITFWTLVQNFLQINPYIVFSLMYSRSHRD